jgi:bifunctional enzyme CysN/CysC
LTEQVATRLSADAGPAGHDLLRFVTCGSVDDGKSTMIGRLLHDTGRIPSDQLAALARDSRKFGTVGEGIDFALLLDGLEAEREQGITIDVAYRYFSTDRRSFIIADAPGHEQYTRNMATGASTAQLAVVLLDARKGLVAQTRRHLFICSFLGIRHVVAAVNKMDLVGYSEGAFTTIARECASLASQLGFASMTPIPMAACFGDNVAARSGNMPWHHGPTLLEHLEQVEVGRDDIAAPFRFHVQWINRSSPEFRGYAGTVASGRVARGDTVVVATSGKSAVVADIVTYDGRRPDAQAGDAVTLTFADPVDVARGDVLAASTIRPQVSEQFAAHIVWMDDDALVPSRTYLMRIGTRTVPASITGIKYKIDVTTGQHLATHTLAANDIALCNVSTAAPVAFDPYAENHKTGSFILIDRFTNRTLGAGMITFGLRRGTNIHWQPLLIGKSERANLKKQRPAIVWLTGLPASGKSTVANLVEQRLFTAGYHTMLLDGDNVRHGLNRDLGFTEADRVENIRRAGEVAKLMLDSGLIVICAFISPYRAERQMVRELFGPDEFIEVFVDTPIEDCVKRDPKGLYAKARGGDLKNFTGVDAPYETPERPEVHLVTAEHTAEQSAQQLIDALAKQHIIGSA